MYENNLNTLAAHPQLAYQESLPGIWSPPESRLDLLAGSSGQGRIRVSRRNSPGQNRAKVRATSQCRSLRNMKYLSEQ